MVNDGDILVSLADAAVRRAGTLAKSVQPYSATAITKRLASDYASDDAAFDWTRLGGDVAGLFRAPPELAFLCGPLEKPEKERKAAQRKKKVLVDDGEEETGYDVNSGLRAGEAQVRFIPPPQTKTKILTPRPRRSARRRRTCGCRSCRT